MTSENEVFYISEILKDNYSSCSTLKIFPKYLNFENISKKIFALRGLNTKGHIAKFCKNDPNVQTCCGKTFEKTIIIHETVNIDNVSRILINTRITEQNVVMLYDPGSEYSIISRSMCEKLSVKPPLVPVNRCGVGIDHSKFQFDGVIYENLQFTHQDNSAYDLQYEPVLVTSEIKQLFFDYTQNSI